MSDKYKGTTAVSEVTLARCGTRYSEPLIRQSSVELNRRAALSNGYTYVADYTCLTNEIDMFDARNIAKTGKLFKNTRVSFAVNPYQAFSPPSGRTANQDTLNLMDYCRSRLGKRCVLGNNSIRFPEKDDAYTAIYSKQKALGKPLYYQTATPVKIGDWQKTLEWAVQQGASSVELNEAYISYDKTALSLYAEKLRANSY